MTAENQQQDSMGWPDWLVRDNPQLSPVLDSVRLHQEKLWDTVRHGYSYRHIANTEVTQTLDGLQAMGVIPENYNDPRSRAQRAISFHDLPAAYRVAHISYFSVYPRILETLPFVRQLASARLLDAFRTSIWAGDLLVPLICIRGIIEQVAHLHAVLVKIGEYSVPETYAAANLLLPDVGNLLLKAGFATRIDWKKLAVPDANEKIDQSKIKYERKKNRADREASSILNAIDLLSKEVLGTRAVYEVLCEFAHPNVGGLLLFTETAKPQKDARDVLWIENRIGPGTPDIFLKSFQGSIMRVFEQLERCLRHFDVLRERGENARQKVLMITQRVVHHLVNANSELFDTYSLCPCGSMKKLRFCIRKATNDPRP